jgi:hypothetical protein
VRPTGLDLLVVFSVLFAAAALAVRNIGRGGEQA